MKLLEMSSSPLMVWLLYSSSLVLALTPTTTTTITTTKTQLPLAPTGSGPDYVKACLSASASYNSAASVWSKQHETLSTRTQTLGGIEYLAVNYIANASTLCDGHPRVTQSNYTILSTGFITRTNPVEGYSTVTETGGIAFTQPSPTCSISPSDCDPLWSTYLKSLSAQGPHTTSPPLTTPPCINQTAASRYSSLDSSIYGCGKCTIYGEGVQLVFWPEPATVTRDMCASTPTAKLTHYGPGAVITAYAGKSIGTNTSDCGSAEGYATADNGKEVIVADGHEFTAGTAYISISKVYALDRCTKTYGKGVKDAILAMPSESVLSLRYSQDHFQRLMETDKITGYPVNFADFHTPIPWSAWNGQNQCQGPRDNAYCTVINENYFRPQLAIPPQITDLSPDFKDCQMWYNGLWDPPLALTERASVAKPTLPAAYTQHAPAYTQPASPSSTAPAPTAAVTALPNERPASTAPQPAPPGKQPEDHAPSHPADSPEARPHSSPAYLFPVPAVPKPTMPAANGPPPSNEPWTSSFVVDGKTYAATGSNEQANIGTLTYSRGGPAQTLRPGVIVSYGDDGFVIDQQITTGLDTVHPTPVGPDADKATVTVSGSALTVVQSSDGGVVVVGMHTLTPGANPVTLDDGWVLSAAASGVAVYLPSTVGVSCSSAVGGSNSTRESSSSRSASSSSGGRSTTTANSATTATADAAQTSSPADSGSMMFSAPVFNSVLVVLFLAVVLAV